MVIGDEGHHPNSPSAQGLCVRERVSQLISDTEDLVREPDKFLEYG